MHPKNNSLFYLSMKRILKTILAGAGLFYSLSAKAQDPGFFLTDWQPKNIISPAYNDVAKPGTSPTTTVNIDVNSVVTKVSKYLFGNNSNPYMGQLVTEPALLNYLKDLSPNVIRAPGGSISDIYFFNTGTVPPADIPDSLYDTNGNKVPAGYWIGKNTASWTLSIDNYYSALKQTGNQGIITINYAYARYGTGPTPVQTAAHLAADWVRYDSGRTKLWEIGNESAGNWEAGYKIDLSKNNDGQPLIITGALYGQHFKIFADSMRKAATEVGSTIHIGAQMVQYDASGDPEPSKSWNSGFFSNAGNAADFFIVHDYYTPYGQNSTPDIILNSAAQETKKVMDWMKTTTQRGGVDLKPIALTEWNIFATGSMQMVSHISGLHADLVLGELLKNKFAQASRWDLANGWSNGDDHGLFNIGDEPGGAPKWNPRPAFYLLYYFQKYFGDQMVASTVTGNLDINTYASTFSSGQAGVVVVNKGPSSQVVKLSFQNFFPGDRYYWYTLTGDNDNGQFSRKVLVNGNGPSGISGGPANYAGIKANSSQSNNNVLITAPPYSASFVIVERSNSTTGVVDIDPSNKLIRLYPNPTVNGNFTISFKGFTSAGQADINITNAAGQLVFRKSARISPTMEIDRFLQTGVYLVKITTEKGVTVKTLVVK